MIVTAGWSEETSRLGCAGPWITWFTAGRLLREQGSQLTTTQWFAAVRNHRQHRHRGQHVLIVITDRDVVSSPPTDNASPNHVRGVGRAGTIPAITVAIGKGFRPCLRARARGTCSSQAQDERTAFGGTWWHRTAPDGNAARQRRNLTPPSWRVHGANDNAFDMRKQMLHNAFSADCYGWTVATAPSQALRRRHEAA